MGCTVSSNCPERRLPSCDPFRETPVRLLGYASHVGNACSAVLPCQFQHLPSMITTAYVTSDLFNKAIKASEAGRTRKQVFAHTIDALIWQSLATIFIPGLIINKLKQITERATKPPANSCAPPPVLVKALPPTVLRALPCIVGVLSLPLIRMPIDKAVSKLMDVTYRPIFLEQDASEVKNIEKKGKDAKNQVDKNKK